MPKYKGTDNITLVNQVQENNHSSTELGKHHFNILARLRKERGLDFQSTEIPTVPEEDDFIEFPFRQLSATIVGGGSWKATDFSEGNVLKKSMSMLENVPAYTNHNLFVGNEIGYIGKPTWTKEYTNADGVKIPAGIDAPFIIDKVLHPKLVRQLNSKRSPVKSSSVTVVFEWEASHDFDREWDFWDNLGQLGEDGQMVRRIVTKITSYYESSLVWLGADPFAGKLSEDGEVVEVDRASVVSNSIDSVEYSSIYKKDKKYFVYSCTEKEKDILLKMNKDSSGDSTIKNNKETAMNKKLLEKIAKFNNVDIENVTEEMIAKFDVVSIDELSSLNDSKEKVATLTKEKEDLEAEKNQLELEKKNSEDEVVALKATISENEELVKAGQASLSSMKDHVKGLYVKFAGDNVDDEIVKEIEENNYSQLEAKLKLYGDKSVEKFGATCAKCNTGENISYRSSLDSGSTNPTKVISKGRMSEVVQSLR